MDLVLTEMGFKIGVAMSLIGIFFWLRRIENK
jgi:hypothetical protein